MVYAKGLQKAIFSFFCFACVYFVIY